jgi:hypothetical protein
MALAPADRHDLLRIIEIDSFDSDRLAEHLRAEGTRQVLLQHAEKSELSPRTFCTFARELSSRRLTPHTALQELSGESEGPMIIA